MAKGPQIEKLSELVETYNNIKPEIVTRLIEFKDVWENGTDVDVFLELSFCLMTPQSKARSCWSTVQDLCESGLIWDGDAGQLAERMNRVRFRNVKAKNIIIVRDTFVNGKTITFRKQLLRIASPEERREWLVDNIRGMGYKEASHLLRNLGQGQNLSILDRHILKNLVILKVISVVPSSITKKKYLEIEKKMSVFSKRVKIPMDHLDLVLWYKEAGEIFR